MQSGITVIKSQEAPAPLPEFIYCQKCGLKNRQNCFKCTSCGFSLHEQRPRFEVKEVGVFGITLPYKNSKAVWAYYFGLLSLLPLLGIFSGIAAFFLGIGGVRCAKLHPEFRGKVHAWVGVIMGGLLAPTWTFLQTQRIIEILNGQ